MWHYLKFFHYYVIVLVACIFLLAADFYILIGFALFIGIYVTGDALLGTDLSTPTLDNKTFINIMLYGSLPMSLLIISICLWLVSPNQWLVMQFISDIVPYNLLDAKANTSVFELIVAVVFAGFMLSGISTVVGHELVHRIGKKHDVALGRWLMSLSFDANFSIEHVYHHHAKVATLDDSVTAPRGRNVYVHIVKAIVGTNKSAWRIEKKRLERKQQHIFSYHNIFIRGCLMTATYLTIVGFISGWQGVLFLSAIGLTAKIILEIVNYMEHYGLVRCPKQPVKPKHSWNSNHKISNWAMFNLPRHSHHHAQGAVPFERLQPMPEAPLMISGYISTIVIALIPPLWFALMKPKLAHWDAHFANQRELDILQQQAHDKQKLQKWQALLS